MHSLVLQGRVEFLLAASTGGMSESSVLFMVLDHLNRHSDMSISHIGIPHRTFNSWLHMETVTGSVCAGINMYS